MKVADGTLIFHALPHRQRLSDARTLWRTMRVYPHRSTTGRALLSPGRAGASSMSALKINPKKWKP